MATASNVNLLAAFLAHRGFLSLSSAPHCDAIIVCGSAVLATVAAAVEALRLGRRDEVVKMCEHSSQPEMMVALRMALDGADDGVAMAAAEIQRHRLERFSVLMSTIIKSFQVLGAQTQLADPRGVSGGIGEALITTASGLTVALISLFPYMIFKGLADRAMGRMESVIAAAQTGLPRRPAPAAESLQSSVGA